MIKYKWLIKGRTKKHGNFILSKNNFDYADPFILNNRYILFEKLNHQEKIGRIYCYDLDKKIEYLLLDNGRHLSFPFIFKDDNQIFVLPEEVYLNKLSRYEIIIDSNENLKIKNNSEFVIKKGRIVDSMFLRINDKILMLYNEDLGPTGDPGSFLKIAEIELNSWQIKKDFILSADSRICRNAGLFTIHKNNIFFATQNRVAGVYGCGFYINKLILDKNRYCFKQTYKKYQNSGIHHIFVEPKKDGIIWDKNLYL